MYPSFLARGAAVIVKRKAPWGRKSISHSNLACIRHASDILGLCGSNCLTEPAHTVRALSVGAPSGEAARWDATRLLFKHSFSSAAIDIKESFDGAAVVVETDGGNQSSDSWPASSSSKPSAVGSNLDPNGGNQSSDSWPASSSSSSSSSKPSVVGSNLEINGGNQSSESWPPSSSSSKPSAAASNDVCGEPHLKQLVNKLVAATMTDDKASTGAFLSELRRYDGPMKPDAFHPVMRICRFKKGRSSIAKELVDIMKEKGVKGRGCVDANLLRSLCADRNLPEAMAVLEGVAKVHSEDPTGSHLRPSLCNAVLGAAVSASNVKVHDAVISLMHKHGIKPNLRTHVEMIKMAGVGEDRRKVRAKWAEVSATFQQQLPAPFHTARVIGLARAGGIWEARLALEDMKDAMRKNGWEPSSAAASLGNLPRARAPQREEDGEWNPVSAAEEIRAEERVMDGWGWEMSGDLMRGYHGLIVAAVTDGDEDLVKQLLLERMELGLGSYNRVREYNFLLGAAANAGNLDEVYRLACLMSANNIRVDQSSYLAWIKAHCNSNDVVAALDILNGALHRNLLEKNMFRYIGHACFHMGNREHMKTTIRRMKQANLPAHDRFTTFFTDIGMQMSQNGMCQRTVLTRIHALRKKMLNARIKHSPLTLHAQIWALGQAGAVDEIMMNIKSLRFMRHHQKWRLLNLLIFNTAIHACCSNGKMEEMHKLMDMMREDNVLPDIAADNSLRSQVTYADADLPSARRVLQALRSSGRTPDLFTFKYLIQVVSHVGDLGAGLTLLSEMEENGIQPDRETFRTLLLYAARHGALDVMEQMVERMLQEKVPFDADACLAVVSAYVRSKRHIDALRALDELGSQVNVAPEGLNWRHESRGVVTGGECKDGMAPLVLDLNRLRELIERGSKNEVASEIA